METMKATQFKVGKLEGLTDRLGKPAKLSDVSVSSSDETVVTAAYAAGEVTVTAVAQGSARVVLTGDASVDEGLQPFEAIAEFEIQSGDVVAGSLVFGPPQEQ